LLEQIRQPLESMCAAVEGTLLASVMGFDGLPVDTVQPEVGEMDVASLLVEYSSLIGQIRKSAQMFAAGELEELSLRSEHLITLIRPVNRDYFVALALLPHANSGKARYLLRINAPKLAELLE